MAHSSCYTLYIYIYIYIYIYNMTKIKLTPNFTAIVTAHGKTRAYLHRFKIIESPECPCDGGNQTVDHILYDCIKLQKEREQLTQNLSNHDSWPVKKKKSSSEKNTSNISYSS
jgi:hypothetical protein